MADEIPRIQQSRIKTTRNQNSAQTKQKTALVFAARPFFFWLLLGGVGGNRHRAQPDIP